MAAILLPQPWTRQPGAVTQLDVSHWSYAKTVYAANLKQGLWPGRLLPSSAPYAVGSLPLTHASDVSGVLATGGTAFRFVDAGNIAAGDFAVRVIHVPRTWNAGGYVALFDKADSANRECSLFFDGAGRVNYLEVGWDAVVPSGTIALTTGKLWDTVCTRVGSTVSIYQNGILDVSITCTGSTAAPTFPFSFGDNPSTGGTTYDGVYAYVQAWAGRGFSASEVAAMSGDRWKIFAPLPRRIFVGPSAGGAYTLTANAGAFSLGGQDATILKTRIVTADAGAFSLSGQDATISYLSGYILTADAGAFALSGQSATILRNKVVTADAGVFTLSGQDASIVYTPAGSYSLAAEAGAFTLSGQSATIYKTKRITADAGAFTLSGQSASFIYSGAPVVTVEVPRQEGIDWGALVQKSWGKEYGKPEYEYEFSNGRRFLEKNNPYS